METIIELFERSCNLFPGQPYLWEKVHGEFVSTSYSQVKKKALQCAGALHLLGLQKGERVALLSEGCNNWIYAELGILYAGGVNVPLSIKLTDSEIIFRVEHSQSRFLIVSANFLPRIRRIKSQFSVVEKIIVFKGREEIPDFPVFEMLLEEGEVWMERHPDRFRSRLNAIVSSDLVNISYTSGTTADPKGIMLSHKNYVTNVLQADSLIQIPSSYKVLLFLPWDHSFAHTVGIYSFMYNGASIAAVDFGRSPIEYLRNIPENLKEVKPDILLSVPSLAKNFKRSIEVGVREKGRQTERLYRWGLRIAYLYNGLGDDRGKGLKALLKPLVNLFDRLIFAQIRQIFGGNLKFFIGGGALLDIDLQRYYAALGVPMYQGYGLSEAAPVISSNTPRHHKYGSSGQVVKPLGIQICDEQGTPLSFGEKGELWVKGDNVMEGYWRNPKSTKEAIVDDWFHTGDLGYIEPEGWLYVLGRNKSLLIANDGEKYSPETIEETVAEHARFIEYCILYNNQSPYTVGLIAPNVQALKDFVRESKLDLEREESWRLLLQKIQEDLSVYRTGGKFSYLFPERWLPAAIAILPEKLSDSNGMINSSMKVVRGKVTERFFDEITYLYTAEGKPLENARNSSNLKQYFKQYS